jgi:hypothetical protein
MTHLVMAIVSMFALALLAWLAGRVSRVSVCPVCVGVAGTWLWMLAARLGGYAVDSAILAMLLGASVVGIAQWIESRLPQGRSPLLWKALALPTGFSAAYALAVEQWVVAAAAIAAHALLIALFLRPARAASGDPEAVAQLEERMKKCC